MTTSKRQLQGLLGVDKPGLTCAADRLPLEEIDRLPTSHDIVQQIRRWTGQRRIGHTGTLDPMASGVLVLCLGVATRLVEYLQGHDKKYSAHIKLGAATDTYDATGRVTHTRSPSLYSVSELETVLERFRGDILQVPPIYSALKRGGESLHRKARRGETVTVEPRPVTIRTLSLRAFHPPDMLDIIVTCTAGTYVRSLAHDIGRALDTYGHLVQLRRLASGPFTLDDVHTMASIECAAKQNVIHQLVLPLGSGLHLPRLVLEPDELVRLGHGQTIITNAKPVRADKLPGDGFTAADQSGILVQVYDTENNFAGIARYLGDADHYRGGIWKAEKWFVTP